MPSRGASNSETAKEEIDFSSEELGLFYGALSAARNRFGYVARDIILDYSLGPRGPWIVGLLGSREISPLELANLYQVSRSVVTAELRQLQDAGLIVYERNEKDGRFVDLSLTAEGYVVRDRLSKNMADLLRARLSNHSKSDILKAAKILEDFAEGFHY